MDIHRRVALVALAAPSGLLLAACAGLGGAPTVTLSQAELERLLRRSFPIERRVLDLFDMSLQPPVLQLLPERNRVAAVLALRARERLLGGAWTGQLSFDASLRWEASDQTLRLAQVRVQDLALVDPSAPLRNAAERIGAAVTELMLEDLSLYRLPAERWLELQRRGVTPGAVAVTPRGVEITFVPLAR